MTQFLAETVHNFKKNSKKSEIFLVDVGNQNQRYEARVGFRIRIKINGMKPVWASPGMNALMAFPGHSAGYKAYKGFTGA